MELKVYAVYDLKAEAYDRPFFLPKDGQAVRGFTDAINSEKSALHSHPEDFSLFCIGTYDDSTGIIVGITPPRFIVKGNECVSGS